MIKNILKQIYNKVICFPYLTVGILQLLCVLSAFGKYIFHPKKYMFLNVFDGLKNYFTLYKYVTQPASDKGFLYFGQLNYPFGDYIFFTDNTPFLAIPLRLIQQNIADISEYIVASHNLLFIFLQWLSALLVFRLIRPAGNRNILPAVLIAVGLSWVQPQILKIVYGVSNLSVSVFPILCLLLLKDIYRILIGNERKGLLRTSVFAFLLISVSATFHLYYIVILALPIMLFTGICGLHQIIKKRGQGLYKAICFTFATISGGVVIRLWINYIDRYKDLRKGGAEGFGWDYWAFIPESLFTPYPFNKITPLIKSCLTQEISPESHSFMGNFTFYNLLITLFILIYIMTRNRYGRSFLRTYVANRKYYVILALVAFFVYTTASGTYVRFCFIPLSFDNWLSLLYPFYKKFPLITQFRCLGRFTWPGFWIISLISVSLFFRYIRWFRLRNLTFSRILASFLILILISDTIDSMKFQKDLTNGNIYQKEIISERFKDLKDINFNDYQAIYTIPAVISGSENYDITTNDRAVWTQYWTQLSIYTGLPLFNCNISRTALNQAQAQFNIPATQTVDTLISSRLDDRKVLVIYWEEFEKNYDVQITEAARPAAVNGSKLISKFRMDSLTNIDGIRYYEWDIAKYHE